MTPEPDESGGPVPHGGERQNEGNCLLPCAELKPREQAGPRPGRSRSVRGVAASAAPSFARAFFEADRTRARACRG